jgi:hypothetical protein
MSFGWMRHDGDPSWHAVAAVEHNGSTITRCRGRWSTSDNFLLVDAQQDPPHAERCDACVRALIDLRCVTRGLDELEQRTCDETSGLAHLFDHGGES